MRTNTVTIPYNAINRRTFFKNTIQIAIRTIGQTAIANNPITKRTLMDNAAILTPISAILNDTIFQYTTLHRSTIPKGFRLIGVTMIKSESFDRNSACSIIT